MDEDNLDEIVYEIFTKGPGQPNTIELDLSDDITQEYAKAEGENFFIYNILLKITYMGIKILFGENRKIIDLTEDEYLLVKRYTLSYGYTLIITGNNSRFSPWDLINRGIKVSNFQVDFERHY